MKILFATVALVMGFALLMVGWSIGGRLMTEKSDYAFFEGIAVRAVLAGAVISGTAFVIRKIVAWDTKDKNGIK